ncbi:Fanconi anemia group C protein isoform X3 [Haemorhous mexicanus]|uniref:Fanconi anemia group C protein isoform X3 n=1 Tax=Haemorhous mexicanus TaxID=30427 RepID=UPI0028BDF22B|nr:Fanconi anemia group C protein isoform X3 [Haemorhous mexicanus]
MAQDTTVPKLNFEYWLDKAIEWGQTTTLESQKDVCLHLPQLQEFLHQLYETIKHLDPTAAIQQFPLIGQLLGRLCWNPFVIGYDESQKTLMWCLCCLYSSEPQNAVELKANSWIRSLLCHLLSSSKWESNEAETSTFISALGYTSADYYCHLVKNMVVSLVTELRENQFNGLNIQESISARRVNAISIFCVPLITLPDLTPLLETLLLYHGGSSKEVLSSEFLEAVNEAFLKNALMETDGTSEVMTIIKVFTQLFLLAYQNENKQPKFPLKAYFPYHHQPLVRSLVRRPFELSTTYWSQHVKHISDMLKALVEDTNVSSLTDLFEIWFLVACFGEWLDIATEQLLKAAVEPDPVLWLLAFYYCPKNENQQRTQTMVEAQAVYNHLMMLFSCTDLSLKDLEAAVHRVTGIEQCCNQRLTTHLLTSFLLFSSGGHKIAQECIYHITEITDTSKDVYNLLIHTAYRLNHSGEENQRTVKLINELLQKLKLKV